MSSDNILDFFNINWVSNIWTGLVTSAILGILNWFLGKRKYKQKINEANREILITLESFIAEKEYPNPSVLLSLHKSLSKKYDVQKEDMDTFEDLVNELVRKVMASKFLSYEDKLNHSNRLIQLKSKINIVSLASPAVTKYPSSNNGIAVSEEKVNYNGKLPKDKHGYIDDNTMKRKYFMFKKIAERIADKASFALPIMAAVTLVNMLNSKVLQPEDYTGISGKVQQLFIPLAPIVTVITLLLILLYFLSLKLTSLFKDKENKN